MALVTKEETLGRAPAQDATPQSANVTAKPATPGVHANAVSLEVPVKVHGSRPASDNSQSDRFEEQTSTMIVFPEGGVLRMAAAVAAGQMLVLTNLKSRQDAICRVVKVRAFSKAQSYVEVEFTRPQASYWGVYFAPPEPDHSASAPGSSPTRSADDTPEPALSVDLPAPPAEPTTPEPLEDLADSHEVNPVKLPAPPPPAPKPSSPFVSLGIRENVQPAAAATSSVRPPEEQSGLLASPRVQPSIRESSPYASPVRDRSSRNSSSQFTSPTASTPSALASDGMLSERVTAGSLADTNEDLSLNLEEVSPAAPEPVSPATPFRAGSFGTRLDSKLGYAEAASPEPRQNWLLVVAAVVVLLGTAAGGAWYFRSNFTKHAVSASANSPAQREQSAPNPSAPPAVQPSAPTQPASSAATDAVPASGTASPPQRQNEALASATHPTSKPTPGGAAVKLGEQSQFSVESAPVQPSTPPQPAAKPGATSSMLSASAMKAHPLTSQRDISSPAAPVLNVADGISHNPASLPAFGSSGGPAIPLPSDAASAPMQVGGTVKQPKLVSSVMPVYPLSAREANIQGDVVIDTQISPKGSVTSMKVISGPTMLRQAALDALRRWKYQPSQLDGKPVAVQMLVTIRFRL